MPVFRTLFFALSVAVIPIGCIRPGNPSAPALLAPGEGAVSTTSAPAAAATLDAREPSDSGGLTQRFVREGISVELTLLPLHADARPSGELREGDDVKFRFRIRDTATGTGLANLHPAAWLAPRNDKERQEQAAIAKRIAGFISGGRLSRPELDLNVFYVLALNGDATITVVDPLFGFGGTKLLAMLSLPSNGFDWVVTADQSTLFVTLPASNQVAVIDTASWTVTRRIDVERQPTRLALQPDEHYLWVTCELADNPSAKSGVAVLATDDLEVKARIATGGGRHEIAFTPDNQLALVTNRDAGTVSVVDVRRLEKRADIETGPQPSSIAFSPAGRMMYVTHERDGSIAVIHPEKRVVVHRIQGEPGLALIKFAPHGRLGLAVNPQAKLVHVLDSATNRIVQTADTEEGPDQITFSDRIAYVRQSGSASVRMIPLDGLGVEGQPVKVVDFPGGRSPLGQQTQPSLADAVVPAPGEGAVLVANPADKAIYFYKEGMAAPSGSFNNYGREPRAVLTVDRSFRPRGPGVYETVARLRRPGHYDLAFLLDSPRLVHCFDVSVLPNPELERQSTRAEVEVQPLSVKLTAVAGNTSRIEFRLIDRATGEPRTELKDVTVLTFLPGTWQKRHPAEPFEGGAYAIDFVPPRAGLYYVYVEAPSAGLALNNPRFFTLAVTEADHAGDER